MRVIEHAAQSCFAGEAADVVDPEPFVEERRRLPVEEQRPDERPGQKSEQCGEEAPRIGGSAPFAEERQQDRDQHEHARAEQTLGEECDAGAGADDEARRACEAVQAEGDAGQERVVSNELMRVLEVTHAARQDERGGKRRLTPILCREIGERQREQNVEGGGEASGIVQRQQVTHGIGEKRRAPVEKRRLLDEGLARERRHQPVAVLEDVIDEAEGVRLVGLPRIVAHQPERNPRREQGDARESLHAGCATTLRNSPSSLSASVSFSSSFCAQASSAA